MSTFSRRLARECIMQVLFAVELRKEPIQKVAEGILPEELLTDEKAKEFTYKIINGVFNNLPTIDTFISKHADNWELSRMAVIDKNLMRMAISEILFMDDVPPKVSINEAIEISKKFSTEKSGKFINGVLDATLNELKAAGKLTKAGRGLVDLPAKHPKDALPPASPPATPVASPPILPQAAEIKQTGKPGTKQGFNSNPKQSAPKTVKSGRKGSA
ncbi:MAG: transcription antitermination factor NusB [Chloroherpetonaceae bacterium]|nr:transcription antitermination factor NusB [Chloroherpetonaceae bacterium]